VNKQTNIADINPQFDVNAPSEAKARGASKWMFVTTRYAYLDCRRLDLLLTDRSWTCSIIQLRYS